tara:strand:- start:662 stop:961 length:300 start_codon:yes stop_codon:yes gene_type:complete
MSTKVTVKLLDQIAIDFLSFASKWREDNVENGDAESRRHAYERFSAERKEWMDRLGNIAETMDSERVRWAREDASERMWRECEYTLGFIHGARSPRGSS